MKRIAGALLALAALVVLLVVTTTSKHGVRAVYAESGCNVSTLKGNYGLTLSGFLVDNNTSQPFYGEGLVTFDGAGKLSGTLNFSLNGVPTLNNPYTATYTVNPDCTGLANGTMGSDSLAFVILDHGAEILATDISAPDTLNADFKKQERSHDKDE
ncbi:MAG TPA: hypothetical protein VN982_05690 [Candidatus Dormibacteraeota bacterium]|nr:hypothetical protein [Candidatus Dormibacteraeota bacterium]